jgi:hypothetical protein
MEKLEMLTWPRHVNRTFIGEHCWRYFEPVMLVKF